MSKRCTGGILFLSLLSSASISYAAIACIDLFNGPKPVYSSDSSIENTLEARIRSINSAESLAKFLEEVGQIGPANREVAVSLAKLIYQELGQYEVEKLVRNLLTNHSHLSQEAVFSAFITHARGETYGARSIEAYLPRPISKEVYLRWHQLGERPTENKEFMNQLELALGDFKNFEPIYGKSIDAKKSLIEMIESLKNLNNPSLVGQFIEFFGKADRLTRQYIFGKMVELKSIEDNARTAVLKGSSSQERNASAKALENILKKSINQLQEEAYISYRSNGNSKKPQIHDLETAKAVALRFIKRKSFDLLEDDVKDASEILAQYPKADKAIDTALLKLLHSRSKMQDWEHKYNDLNYAQLELVMLERSARGLSGALNIELQYTKQVLASKTDYVIFLRNLLEFHSQFDLRKFPILQQMAIKYFREYPESLHRLQELVPAETQNFIKLL